MGTEEGFLSDSELVTPNTNSVSVIMFINNVPEFGTEFGVKFSPNLDSWNGFAPQPLSPYSLQITSKFLFKETHSKSRPLNWANESVHLNEAHTFSPITSSSLTSVHCFPCCMQSFLQ